ncbi:nucleotide sugar dehydrogenase [Vibrio plantisponsor]|uniref:UDP-glucose 6-dehydrogenase n=1 Tax=Vibrio plantisponsor TaxID=664643 RepID=A0ABU4IIB7_9VIBR|nr:nucleotide sugar dehydrogenase [Vibrio plantisponsor]MDW6018307.1 nucleotide sugar dehydrogenase [Vibrio plantisponsor]NNM41888.1 nucleotide sugar dehydrogenase [Vibrio plantisponsor]
MTKIAIAGSGYVGLSNAILLATKNEVVTLDIIPEKVELLNNNISPINDDLIIDYLENKKLNFRATLDKEDAYKGADFIIIATPTNYDEVSGSFDTSSIENVIEDVIRINPKAIIVVKSTIPVGYVEKVKKHFDTDNILFSPEFLREGNALYDSLYPSRIIVGEKSERAKVLANIFKESAIKKDVQILFTDSTEAEAIKLFSNSYLAMRVAYFNEVDSYAEIYNLNTQDIISGVGLDPRIGSHYNNPSFGYGGYCFPKDTKQLKANFKNVPNKLINAIVDSNEIRKEFITSRILDKKPKVVGIYRLIMKSGSDNFRSAAIQDIISNLVENNVRVVIFEPIMKESEYEGLEVIADLTEFKSVADVIVANRTSDELIDVKEKIYTRDILKGDI